ncbi:MAG: NAD(P)H-dependent oxidoreductase [Bacteroidales bacterium]|nr:NAD(P)H-dependent oxidoreductase [Bacteroidales bacterium]MBQ8959544.1 NAD(P)H-dependent oxidoreductase [Bacteroidales bacterium]
MKKILFIIGSLRAKSFNRQLAMMAKEIIGDHAEVSELDFIDLPLINQDLEQPEPAAVARIRKAISGAGGKAATADCRAKLTELLSFIKTDVLPEQIGIAVPDEAWSTDVLTLTDEQMAQLKAQAEKILG